MKTKVMLTALFSVLALGAPAYAELIYGQVAAVDAQNESVTITPRNASADIPQQINLSVKQEALKNNQVVQSLDQLSIGEEIIVEADKPAFGGDWNAQALLTMNQIHPQSAEAGQTETLQYSSGASAVGASLSDPAAATAMASGDPDNLNARQGQSAVEQKPYQAQGIVGANNTQQNQEAMDRATSRI